MTRGGGQRGEQVKAVQQALKDKGHDPGDVDGVMGPKTQAALRDFQKKEGLKETGRLDTETMAKLGVEAKTSSAGGSTSGGSSSPSASPATGSGSAGGSTSPSGAGASGSAPSSSPSKDAGGTKK
jgi:peptidoglycan hydrolase-like protein with peptidoglycan-binding domain